MDVNIAWLSGLRQLIKSKQEPLTHKATVVPRVRKHKATTSLLSHLWTPTLPPACRPSPSLIGPVTLPFLFVAYTQQPNPFSLLGFFPSTNKE